MRQASYVLLLGLVLGLPASVSTFASQARRGFIAQANATQKSKSEDAKVDETVRALIDTIFRQRKIKEAFERYFLFANLPAEQTDELDPTSLRYLQEYSSKNPETVARILAAGWNYEYQPALLALGTKPLSDFSGAFEQAQNEIENERKRILSKRGLSEDDFYRLRGGASVKDQKSLENDLTTLELIDADINRFIEQRTDQAVLARNLAEMQKSASITKINKAGCTLYAVSLKPMFGVLLVSQSGALKMISFGNAG